MMSSRTDEGEGQQGSRKQETVDETVVDPVEAVALVKAGVEQREPDPGIGESWPVEIAQQVQVDLLARRSVPDACEHDRHRDAKLPLDPAPGEVFRIPALERSGDVLRQFRVHRVDGETVDDEALRQIADDEADGERNEGPGSHAGEELRGEEGGEVRRQRPEQGGDEQERHSVQQDAPDAENGAEIGTGDADQHLPDAEAGRHPGALVEPEVQPAAQVGEPEGRDAAPGK